MGGYAWYVWGSMGMTALLLLLEIWQARIAHMNALALARTEHASEQT
jgi:heme exporter protein CcmD